MRLGKMTKKQLLKTAHSKHKIVTVCGFVEIARLIFQNDGSITSITLCSVSSVKLNAIEQNDEKKQLLKTIYSKHKLVTVCEFEMIVRLIFENVGSNTLLFKCRK